MPKTAKPANDQPTEVESLDTTEARARARLADLRTQIAQIDERARTTEEQLAALDEQLADAQRQVVALGQQRDQMPEAIQHARANLLIMAGTAAEAQAVERVETEQTRQRDLKAQCAAAQAHYHETEERIANERAAIDARRDQDAATRASLEPLVSALDAQIAEIHLTRGRQVLDAIRSELAAHTHTADESRAVADAATQDLATFRAGILARMEGYPELAVEAHALLPVPASPTVEVLDAYDALLATIERHAGHIRHEINGVPLGHLLSFNGMAMFYVFANASTANLITDLRSQVARLRPSA